MAIAFRSTFSLVIAFALVSGLEVLSVAGVTPAPIVGDARADDACAGIDPTTGEVTYSPENCIHSPGP